MLTGEGRRARRGARRWTPAPTTSCPSRSRTSCWSPGCGRCCAAAGAERPAVLAVGDLRLDPAAHRVWRGDDADRRSRPRQFALLEFLMRRPGEVLSKSEILEHVWDFAFDGDPNIVEVYVAPAAPADRRAVRPASLADRARWWATGSTSTAADVPRGGTLGSVRGRITAAAPRRSWPSRWWPVPRCWLFTLQRSLARSRRRASRGPGSRDVAALAAGGRAPARADARPATTSLVQVVDAARPRSSPRRERRGADRRSPRSARTARAVGT